MIKDAAKKLNGVFLLALVLFILFLFSSTIVLATFQKTSDLGLPLNTARIFDFNNDGKNEILAFSDKINPALAPITYYTQLANGSFVLNQTLSPSEINLSRCSLSYNDLNDDGYLDIVYYCLSGSYVISEIWSYDGTTFIQTNNYSSSLNNHNLAGGSFNYSSSVVGDTLFYDFNNDGKADILSCFDSSNGNLSLKISNGDFTFFNYSSGISASRFFISTNISNNLISSCYLLPLDYDADGDYDIIAYRYDDHTFSLYKNALCNLTGCKSSSPSNYNNAFQEVPFSDYVNDTFFNSNTKIKYLKAFDSNSDGYSDLYYITDNGNFTDSSISSCNTSSTGCRNITFGNFINQHRRLTQTVTVSPPVFNLFNYSLGTKYIILTNFTGINQSGQDDLFDLSLSSGIEIYNLENILDNKTNHIYYNINLTNTTKGTIISGDYFVNSYDYNNNLGNLLTRNNVPLKISNQCINATAQAIAPSQLQSNLSYYNYQNSITFNSTSNSIITQPIEFCDGLDNDCDGKVDNNFTFMWPDGNASIISFDSDSDKHVPQNKTLSYLNWSIFFDCSAKKINEKNYHSNETYWDSNDYDSTEWCSLDSVTYCGSKYTKGNADAGNGGSSSGLTTPPAPVPTVPEETPAVENPITEVIPPIAPPVIPPTTEKPQGSSKSISDNYIQEITFGAIRVYREIQYSEGNTVVIETIKNLGVFDSEGVSLRVNIPKEIVSSATEITKLNDFNIIEDDPIIDFDLGNLASGNQKVIQYKIDGRISELLIDKIMTDVITKNLSSEEQQKAKIELDKQITDTAKAINITQTAEIVGNKTILTVNLDVNKNASLTNVSVYQEVPKCLINVINDMVANSKDKFEIVEADPLIVWHFDKLVDARKVQLVIDGVADDNCLNQAKTMAVAKEIIFSTAKINYLNLWLAILLIPLIAFFIIFIGEFSNIRAHKDKEINDLINYIKEHYRKGLTKEQIIEKLLKEGQNIENINKAIKLNAKTWLHFLIQKVDFGIHEAVLVLFIVLDFIDFMNYLPADVDYFKKIVSWALLGYLVYRISITDVINGNKKGWIDVSLILLFFIMTLKNLIGAAKSSLSGIDPSNLAETKFIAFDLYNYIVLHNDVFEKYLFIAGLVGVLIVAFVMAKDKIKDPSSLSSFKLENYYKRAIFNFIALLAFFVVIFNLIFEWLAIVVDAFITVAIVIGVIILVFKHRHKFGIGKIVEDMAGKAESFYEDFVGLFHYKRFLPLALSGMLILYVLTEISNYLIPYMIGLKSEIYFGSLGELGRLPLFMLTSFTDFSTSFFDPTLSLFAFQTAGTGLLLTIVIAICYILNLIALLYLLFLPGMVWYNRFKQKDISITEYVRLKLSTFQIWLFSLSALIFILRPVFTITEIQISDIISDTQKLVGVDFLTHSIKTDFLPLILLFAVIVSFLLAFVSYLGTKYNKKTQQVITDYLLIGSFVFFTIYVYIFMSAQYSYYSNIIISAQGLIALAIFLFAILNLVLLYGLGYFSLLFTYLPLKVQLELTESNALRGLLYSQRFNHIHYRDDHNLIEHGTHHEKLVSYINDSIAAGHELYHVIDNLVIHGWKIEEIDIAVHEAIPDDKLHAGFDHYNHYHHNREVIDNLHKFIKENYYNGSYRFEIKKLIEFILSMTFTADDAINAISKVEVKIDKKYTPHIKSLANYLTLHKDNFVEAIKYAEDKNYTKEFLISSLSEIKTMDSNYGDLLIPVAKQMKDKKVSDNVKELINFKFTEDDVRVALKHIKAMDDDDEEVLKYV